MSQYGHHCHHAVVSVLALGHFGVLWTLQLYSVYKCTGVHYIERVVL